MSKCRVEYNKDQKVYKVYNQDGTQSKLYNKIAKSPAFLDNESAFEAFKYGYYKKVDDSSSYIDYRVGNKSYFSYQSALLNAKQGEKITVNIIDESSEKTNTIEILSKVKDTKSNSTPSFIDRNIENKRIADEKVFTSNGFSFISKGLDIAHKAVNTALIEDDAAYSIGKSNFKKDGNTFQALDNTDNLSEYYKLTKKELENKIGKEKTVDILTAKEYIKNLREESSNTSNVSEQEIKIKLLNLLNNMGVDVMSTSEYVEKYKQRKGIDVSAKALADITNQIVAFKEGKIELQDLAEETAHFINEAMPEDKINELLDGIESTEEYKNFAEYYREIYSKEYSKDEVEDVVRREVLGKVIANSITKNDNSNKNLLNRIKNAIRQFFSRIININNEYKTKLDNYKKEVNNLILEQEISKLDTNFSRKGYRFYSADPSANKGTENLNINKKARGIIRAIKDQIIKSESSEGKMSNIEKSELNKAENNLENAKNMEAVTALIMLAKSYTKRLQKAVDSADKTPLNSNQRVMFYTLKDTVIPALSEMRKDINKLDYDKNAKRIVKKDIESVTKELEDLRAEVDTFSTEAIDNLVEQIMQRHNLGEDYRQRVKNWVEMAEKDTTFFHQNFGQIIHSQDPLLGLVGLKIKDITSDTNEDTMENYQKFVEELNNLGYELKDLNQFVDKKSGTIISEYDWNAFQNKMDEIYLQELKKIKKSVKKTDEEILENKREFEQNELTTAEISELRSNIKRETKPFVERKMKDDYYEGFEKKIDSIKYKEGRDFILNYYQDTSSLKRRATVDGIVDLRNLSEEDLQKYNDIQYIRNYSKNIYDHTGNLKPGIYIGETGEVIVKESELTEESKIALSLRQFDSGYAKNVEEFIENYEEEFGKKPTEKEINDFEESKNFDYSDEFYNMLEEAFAESTEEGLRFLELNSTILFTDVFWDQILGSQSIDNRIEERLQNMPNEKDRMALKSLRTEISKLNTQKREILKQFKKKSSPSEIDAIRMPVATQEKVKELQEELTRKYRTVNEYLEDTDQQIETTAESTSNQSFQAQLEAQDIEIEEGDTDSDILRKIQEQVDFAKKHMTSDNSRRIVEALYHIQKINKGYKSNNKTITNILEENNLEENDLSDASIQSFVVREAINRSLLPYFKSFSPKAYKDFMSFLQTKNTTNTPKQKRELVENLKNSFPEVEVKPNNSFLDSGNNSKINENYRENFYGGAVQPKLSLFRNQDFYDMFGEIQNQDPNNPYSGQATKNKKLWEAYKLVLKENKKGAEAANISESYNLYTLPQIRKQTMQRFKDTTKGISAKSLKEAWEEQTTFTVDEKAQGETQFGDNIKVIPTRYFDKIETDSVSDDLGFSLFARNREAYKKKARIKHYGDFMALGDAIEKRKTANGKDPKTSNTYKMYNSYRDYSLFGVKETWSHTIKLPIIGEVDIAKVVRQIVDYVKFRNLGLNIIVPITSAISTKTQIFIESLVKEHIDRTALRKGRKEMNKLYPDASKEAFKQKRTSKLNVIGAFFNAWDYGEAFNDSNYGKLARFLPKTFMGLHSLANIPFYSEILLGTLHDYKIVDGSLMNKRNFDRAYSDLSKSERNSKWKSNEDYFYNYIKVDKGNLSFNKEGLREKIKDENGQVYTEEKFEEVLNNKVKGIRDRIGEIILNVDTQIPQDMRVAAQRHSLWSIFLTHRNFLIQTISRRTRSNFYNPVTGEQEEGTYRSVSNFFTESVEEVRKKGFKGVVKAFKETWKDASDIEKRNIKRAGTELGVLTAMGAIGYMLVQLADEDEEGDLYSLQATAYFWQRLMNETSSTQAGIVPTITDTLESPIIGLSMVNNVFKLPELFSGDTIERGSYRGETESYRYISRMLPLFNQYNYLQSGKSVKESRQTYEFYNDGTLNLNLHSWIGNMATKEEE